MIELTPVGSCMSCGAKVIDFDIHVEFHEELRQVLQSLLNRSTLTNTHETTTKDTDNASEE